MMAVWAIIILAGFLVGLRLMHSPSTALWGNRLSAFFMILALVLGIREAGAPGNFHLWLLVGLGGAGGIILAQKVKMIHMPQTVALFNGLGGAASALVAGAAAFLYSGTELFVFWLTAALALSIGTLTFSGSIVALLKLQGWISQKPVILKAHGVVSLFFLAAGIFLVILSVTFKGLYLAPFFGLLAFFFAFYGILTTLRVGGADMPVIIAFLNSLSGIAASISGLAVNNPLLAGAGALVGVAGLILTRLMCQAMNRSLSTVLGGFRIISTLVEEELKGTEKEKPEEESSPHDRIPQLLEEAQKIVIVPGYGMAVAQAQGQVKKLVDLLEERGREVRIAIHPVAGRMPGHMNVLLAEAGFDYEKMNDLEAINPELPRTDLVIVVGACDVVNPAANTAEGTPIYGMPVLNVEEASNVIICNMDANPGYSGVENPLYSRKHVLPLWGDAAESLRYLISILAA